MSRIFLFPGKVGLLANVSPRLLSVLWDGFMERKTLEWFPGMRDRMFSTRHKYLRVNRQRSVTAIRTVTTERSEFRLQRKLILVPSAFS